MLSSFKMTKGSAKGYWNDLHSH